MVSSQNDGVLGADEKSLRELKELGVAPEGFLNGNFTTKRRRILEGNVSSMHFFRIDQNQGKTWALVVQKPINANPRLKINQGVYFSTPECCSTLIFSKTLH